MTSKRAQPSEWPVTVMENRNRGAGYRILSLGAHAKFPVPPAGAFVMLSLGKEPEILLRRPMAIYDLKKTRSATRIEILYSVVGKGTLEMTKLQSRQTLSMLGPIGNGFSLPAPHESTAVIAGGIGIAPFLFWSRNLSPAQRKNVAVYFGFRTQEQKTILQDFRRAGLRPRCAIEGPGGDFRGTVVDFFRSELGRVKPSQILTCGPKRMIDAVRALSAEHHFPLEASLEAKMGCGIGVCLSCVTEFQKGSRPGGYALVCQDGPIFSE